MNDVNGRDALWRRFEGDDWAAFEALPTAVRRRLHEHAYEAWSVNVLVLWKRFRRKHGCSARGQVTLLRYLDQLEAMERRAFASGYHAAYGMPLPHDAAAATIQRYS